MDTEPLETNVYVHSPLIEYTATENYYTSYAIHLTSNNPCFSRPASHTRRRYSEFAALRQLLASHHPTLAPPHLPPKNYFQRFNDAFIEQRMRGLQKFLNEVLAIPVYLSDKSLHLFLQSSSSMSEISEECLGDIPAPPLITTPSLTSSYSDTSSSKTSHNLEAQRCARSLHNLVLDDVKIGILPQMPSSRTAEKGLVKTQSPLPSSLRKSSQKPILIPKRNGSLDSIDDEGSSPSSSSSSLENSYSSSSERAKDRRVSFNDQVKVAVVTYYGISVLRP